MADDSEAPGPRLTQEQSKTLRTEVDSLPPETGAASPTDTEETSPQDFPSISSEYVTENYEIVEQERVDDSMFNSLYVKQTYDIVERDRVILIIGKTGNGKSTVGNILLGEQKFDVGRGMSSTTVHSMCMPEKDCTLKVVDTPDISNMDLTEEEKKTEVRKWKDLARPGPHVILLAVRCDVRYTAEEWDIYNEVKRLWGEDEEFKQHLVVGFTFGDRQDKDIGEELETVCDELQSVLRDADRKYVVINSKGSDEVKAKIKESVKERDREKCDQWVVKKPGMLGYLVSFIPTTHIGFADWGYRYVMRPLGTGCGYLVSFPAAGISYCAEVLRSSTQRLGITSSNPEREETVEDPTGTSAS